MICVLMGVGVRYVDEMKNGYGEVMCRVVFFFMIR